MNRAVPQAAKARQAFTEAMDNWDEAAADAAVAGLVRTSKQGDLFEVFCRYGARDFRDIGHKAIYVANSWRTLATHWLAACRAGAAFAGLCAAVSRRRAIRPSVMRSRIVPGGATRHGWRKSVQTGSRASPALEASPELLATLRAGSSDEACDAVVAQLNRGVAPQSIWDALFHGAGELLMRQPGLVALHAVTSTNALHFAYQTCESDETRKMLLLQNAAFLPLFRGDPAGGKSVKIDLFEPLPLKANGASAIEEILADVSNDRMTAARKMLTYLHENPHPEKLIGAARQLVFVKGRNSHDYKFSSAVLEDYYHVSPPWRDRYLAASSFNLCGSGAPDNDLVKRTRAALQA